MLDSPVRRTQSRCNYLTRKAFARNWLCFAFLGKRESRAAAARVKPTWIRRIQANLATDENWLCFVFRRHREPDPTAWSVKLTRFVGFRWIRQAIGFGAAGLAPPVEASMEFNYRIGWKVGRNSLEILEIQSTYWKLALFRISYGASLAPLG